MSRLTWPRLSSTSPHGAAPVKRTALRLRPVSKKRTSRAVLTKLARRLVVELRDQGTCQRCGNSLHDTTHRDRNGKIVPGPPKIDWAHVKAGRASSLIWTPWASMALCAGCHFWYDANGNGAHGSQSRIWWADAFPERDLLLRQWEQQRSRPKFDPEMTSLWLKQELAKLEKLPL